MRLNPHPEGIKGQAQFLRPVNHWHGPTIVGQEMITSSVPRLCRWERPATVPRSVRAVIVNTIQRVTGRRPLAHVCEEVFKRVTPLRAHLDASAPVSMEPVICSVVTPLPHAEPRLVFRRFRLPMSALSGIEFFSKASTRTRRSTEKAMGHNDRVCAAGTAADPIAMSSIFGATVGQADHCVSPERLVQEIAPNHMSIDFTADVAKFRKLFNLDD